MEAALRGLLADDGGVSAIAGARIFWGQAQQGHEQPFIVLNVVAGPHTYAFDRDTGHVDSRVQMDCWAGDYVTAKTLARAAIAAVTGFRGSSGSIDFGGVFVDGERDLNEPRQGDIATRYRVAVDLAVHWKPA